MLLTFYFAGCAVQTAPDALQQEPAAADAPAAAEAAADTAAVEAAAQPEPIAATQPQPVYETHAAYMFGQNGYFFPERQLTRAETAQILVYVFDTADSHTAAFTDVPQDSWFYSCVMAAADLLPGEEDGTFRPYDAVTLAEFAAAICRGTGCRLPQGSAADVLPDAAVRYAALFGWTEKDADAQQNVTRAQAVQILNRALGRTPDTAAIDALTERVFLDVSPEQEAYYDIMEAALEHRFAASDGAESWDGESIFFFPLAPGLHMAGGNALYLLDDGSILTEPGLFTVGRFTYLVSENDGQIYADNALHLVDDQVVFCTPGGTILKNARRYDYFFDENGAYTTGDAMLDAEVAEAIAACTTQDMTQEEKLRACYDYVRSFKYLGRNAALPRTVKTMPYENATAYARKIFETGKGDCYNFAASFCFLARALGYEATAIVGSCGYVWSSTAIAHGWVEIVMGAETYLFDPQIENYNLRAGISNATHGAYQVSYETAPGRYYKN